MTEHRTLKEDALAWFQSLRFSALTFVVLGVLGMAVLILTPNITGYIQQQTELRELRESVELHRKALSEAEAEKLKWSDPVYIKAQARERLYYVMPGETQIAVLTDGVELPVDEETKVSAELTKIESDWPKDLAVSILKAGVTSDSPQDFFKY